MDFKLTNRPTDYRIPAINKHKAQSQWCREVHSFHNHLPFYPMDFHNTACGHAC